MSFIKSNYDEKVNKSKKENKMKRVLVLCLIGILLLSACNKEKKDGNEEVNLNLKNDNNIEVTLDGNKYSLPCKVQEFYDKGFKIGSDSVKKLDDVSGSDEIVELYKDEQYVCRIYVKAEDENLYDNKVTGIVFYSGEAEGIKASIGKIETGRSTIQETIDYFGTDYETLDDINDKEALVTLSYINDKSTITFTFDSDCLIDITINFLVV